MICLRGVSVFGKKAKQKAGAGKTRGRLSLGLALGGTVLIIGMAVIRGDYASLPVQLTGWFTGVALAWAVMSFKKK